jgi:hypothetical protein
MSSPTGKPSNSLTILSASNFSSRPNQEPSNLKRSNVDISNQENIINMANNSFSSSSVPTSPKIDDFKQRRIKKESITIPRPPQIRPSRNPDVPMPFLSLASCEPYFDNLININHMVSELFLSAPNNTSYQYPVFPKVV